MNIHSVIYWYCVGHMILREVYYAGRGLIFNLVKFFHGENKEKRKLESVSPNPRHFQAAATSMGADAVLGVKIEAIYGQG